MRPASWSRIRRMASGSKCADAARAAKSATPAVAVARKTTKPSPRATRSRRYGVLHLVRQCAQAALPRLARLRADVDRKLPGLMRLRESTKTPLFNGALECRLFRFDLIAGSVRNRPAEPANARLAARGLRRASPPSDRRALQSLDELTDRIRRRRLPCPPRARARRAARSRAAASPSCRPRRKCMRNRDADYPYRHDSYFYYLTGFTEPEAALVLDADAKTANRRRSCSAARRTSSAKSGTASASARKARASVRLRRRVPDRRARRSRCRACIADAPALHYALGASADARRASARLAARGARAGAQRRRAPSSAQRPAAAARRDAPGQGRARDRDHAPRRRRFPPRRTARAMQRLRARACASTRSKPNCCTSSAATARSRRPIRLDRRGRRQRLRAALPGRQRDRCRTATWC